MKNIFSLLLAASLLTTTATAPAVAAPVTTTTLATEGITYEQAYYFAVHTVGIDPKDAVYVLSGYPAVTAPQQYLHDQLALLGYEFPTPGA